MYMCACVCVCAVCLSVCACACTCVRMCVCYRTYARRPSLAICQPALFCILIGYLSLQSGGVTSPHTRSTTAASDMATKDSSLDENDLYIKYKKLQRQLESLQV